MFPLMVMIMLPCVESRDIIWKYDMNQASAQLKAAHDYKVWSFHNLNISGDKTWKEVVEDAEWRCDVWNTIYQIAIVQEMFKQEIMLQQWLSVLRDQIGRAAYYNGVIPEPVPYWAVRRMQ